MKKIFLFLIMIIVLGLSIVYMFLFTKFGNDKMASYIENKVNSGQEVKLKVNDVTLTSNQLPTHNHNYSFNTTSGSVTGISALPGLFNVVTSISNNTTTTTTGNIFLIS